MGHGQYGTFFRFLDEIAMTDVWIVDENLNPFTMGKISKSVISLFLKDNTFIFA